MIANDQFYHLCAGWWCYEADDVIANEYDNECDIGYVNADVFEYDNEYESVNVNDCDYVYVYENVYDNE